MPRTVAELLHAALALSVEERAELAELIEDTIPSPPSTLHPSWAEELRRRVAEMKSGLVTPISWGEVRQRVQAQLDASGSSND